MSSLVLKGVGKRFGGLQAVTPFDMEIARGKITGLIGPNGAGKTTVVNLITGVYKLSSGTIQFGDIDLTEAPRHEVARAGLARTFQTIRLLPDATVVANVMIGMYRHQKASLVAQLFGLPSSRAETRRFREEVYHLLDRFGMTKYADYPAGALSYGDQRRVEMMRALALKPEVLLLDEPVAGINEVEAAKLGEIFRKLATEGEGMAVLLIEHNMRFVTSLCDYVYVLDSGILISQGSAEKVVNDPVVVKAYLGTTTMLEIKDLHAGYSGNEVLHGVSVNVEKGDMVAIIGPNGAGKSTMLNCISGILTPTGGSIRLEGREIAGEAAFKISRSGLLQVPEGRQILGDLTVLENLQLGVTALHGRAPTHDLKRIYTLFPILEERNQQRAGSLSGGQQQMLAIGRALMGAPRVLLLDEPSLGLSPLLSKQVLSALRELNREGLTILLVEQNARAALRATKHAFVMEQGRIVHHGASDELARDPDVIAHYLGQAGTKPAAAPAH